MTATVTDEATTLLETLNVSDRTAQDETMRRHVRVLLERIDADQALRECVVRDSIRRALACTWRRRAADLEWARPRPGEFVGRSGRAELTERDERLRDAAMACRRKAAMLEAGWLDE